MRCAEARLGWWRRRLGRRIGCGDAEGVVDGFEKNGHVDRLVNIGDGSGLEGGNVSARTEDDDGDGACVD